MKRFSRFEGFMQNYFENKAKHGPKLKNCLLYLKQHLYTNCRKLKTSKLWAQNKVFYLSIKNKET